MKVPEKDLGKAGKLIKKNITLFDYKDAIYMSKMGYFVALVAGELPAAAMIQRLFLFKVDSIMRVLRSRPS